MPAGTARSTPGITIAITRDPALVRTVRLVAAAVARRTDRDEEFVEEVRLAVGEACALMVGAGGDSRSAAEPVTVRMTLGDVLRVEVACANPVEVEDRAHSDIDGVEPWALLRGLIDDFSIVRSDLTTTVAMSWPAL
jgi:hypothetical protein